MESYNYHKVIVDLIRIIYQYKEDKIIKKETEDLKSNISKLSQEKLFYFLKKQRLIIFLSEFKSLDLYLPSISKKIKSIAKIQKLNALILAKKTKDIAYIFKREKIPILFIKGIPLSLQTTNNPTLRGDGDLDIFVAEKNLYDSINLLKINGFERINGYMPKNLKSKIGTYCLKVRNELPLRKIDSSSKEIIDLHWSLCKTRLNLPSFQNAWDRREKLYIMNQEVNTLGLQDSFIYSCYNSAKDNWNVLRNIIDIERLNKRIIKEDLNNFEFDKIVFYSLVITNFYTKSKESFYPINKRELLFKTKKIIDISIKNQLKKINKNENDQKLYFWNYKNVIEKNLRITRDIKDKIRIILGFTILASSFNDQISGKDRNIFQALFYQLRRFTNNLLKIFKVCLIYFSKNLSKFN